jgi:hypothetical protein
VLDLDTRHLLLEVRGVALNTNPISHAQTTCEVDARDSDLREKVLHPPNLLALDGLGIRHLGTSSYLRRRHFKSDVERAAAARRSDVTIIA